MKRVGAVTLHLLVLVVLPGSRLNLLEQLPSPSNRAAVERADFIKRNSPELAKKVIDGEVPASAAVREIWRAQKKAKFEMLATQ